MKSKRKEELVYLLVRMLHLPENGRMYVCTDLKFSGDILHSL